MQGLYKVVILLNYLCISPISLYLLFLHFRLQRTWNKKSSRWTAHPKKSEKSYTYVKDILRRALVMRIKDSVGMRKKRELEADDPRRIAAHLAPVEPLPTKVLMEEKVSRFK